MENKVSTIEEGKTTAIVSHLTWIGTIVAYFMNKDKKNSFASFYIRQNIGISILFILASIVGSIISIGGTVIFVFALVLWVLSLLGMLKGEEKNVPLLGEQFQEWFKGI